MGVKVSEQKKSEVQTTSKAKVESMKADAKVKAEAAAKEVESKVKSAISDKVKPKVVEIATKQATAKNAGEEIQRLINEAVATFESMPAPSSIADDIKQAQMAQQQ